MEQTTLSHIVSYYNSKIRWGVGFVFKIYVILDAVRFHAKLFCVEKKKYIYFRVAAGWCEIPSEAGAEVRFSKLGAATPAPTRM